MKENSDATPDMDDVTTTELDYWIWFSAGSALEALSKDSRELDAADECLAALMVGVYPDEPDDPSRDIADLPPRLREEYGRHMALLAALKGYSGPFTREALSRLLS